MRISLVNIKNSIADLVEKYRKRLLGALTLVVAYAVLGFFLAPWIFSKLAVDAARNNLDAELRSLLRRA